MKILIAGHTGLIGSQIAHVLRHEHECISLGRRNSDITYDLSTPAELPPAEMLVHAAGVTDEEVKHNPEEAMTRATQGVEQLLEHATQAGITQYVYVSSAHIYGPLQGPLNEQSPPNPQNDYANAHMATETKLIEWVEANPGFRALILRPCAVFGLPPSLDHFARWSLIPYSFPQEAIEHGSITLKSHGLQKRNFVSSLQIGKMVQNWADSDPKNSKPLEIMNPVGVDDLTIREFAHSVAAMYQEITGNKCLVKIPENSGASEPNPLQYGSIHEHQPTGEPLAGFLQTFTKILQKHHEE